SECKQTVTVEDKENPVISGVANISEVSCKASDIVISKPTATDNCDVTEFSVSNDNSDKVTVLIDADGKVSYTGTFPIGKTTIKWTAKDEADNSTTVEQTVTVTDGEIVLPAIDEYKYCADKKLDNGTLKSYIETGLTGKVSYTNLEIVSFTEAEAEFKVTNGFGCAATGKLALTKLSLPDAPKTDFTYCPEAEVSTGLLQSEMVSAYTNASSYKIVVTNVSDDKYSYTVTNTTTNCATSGEFDVKRYKKPYAPKLSVANFCEGTEGKLLGNTTNVVWENAAGPALGKDVTANTYEYAYTYTDGKGCKVDSVLKFEVYATPTSPKVEDMKFCENLAASDKPSLPVSGAGDFAGYTINWTEQYEAISDLKASGSPYTYAYTVTDGNNCVSTETSFSVTVHATPVISVADHCLGSSGYLSIEPAASATDNFVWTDGKEPVLDGSIAGDHSYGYTYTDKNNCVVSGTLTYKVGDYDAPVFADVEFCVNATEKPSLPTTSTEGFKNYASVNWDPANPTELSALVAGDYTYTYYVTDKNGCNSKKRSFAVKVNAKPDTPTLAVENFCEGSAGTFSANIEGIMWADSTPSLKDLTKPEGNYTYKYYYKDNNGCESDRQDLKYTVYAKPTAPKVKDTAFCENLEEKPTLPQSKEGDFKDLEIIWTSQSHGELSTLKAGKYEYSYKVKNDHCESDVASFKVEVYAKPSAPKFEVAEFCEGTAGKLDTVSGIPANSSGLTWSPELPELPDGFAKLSGGKSYTYKYTYTDGKCSVDSSLTFNVKAKPTLPILKVENFCYGAKANLDGVPADGTINWADGKEPVYSAVAGTYTYNYSYTGTNGCTVGGGELTFTIHPKPADPGLDVADFCEGTTGELLNKPSAGKIVWTEGGEPDLSGKVGEYSHKYKIVVTNTDGKQCESEEGSFVYKVHALPQLSATVMQGEETISASNMACPSKDENVDINVSVKDIADATFKYVWSDDNTITTNSRSVALKCGDADKAYTVTVSSVVANAPTCSQNLTINVPVTPAPTLTCNNGSDSYPLENGNTVNVSFTAPTLASTCVDAGGSFKLFEKGDGNAEKLIKESNSWSNLSENLGLGSYKAVFTANDKCLIDNKVNVCEWSFKVTDDDKPSITCKAPLEFEIKSGDQCVYVLQPGDITELPDVYENSSLYTLVGVLQGGTVSDKITVNADGSYTGSITFQKGANTIRWTVTDGALNSAYCDQTVTVLDKVAPGVNCGVDVSVDATDCNANVSIVAPETSDNCGGAVALSAVRLDTKADLTLVGNEVTDNFPIGETVIRWYAEDESGNKDSCDQTVTVNDLEPTITCGASPIEKIAPDNSCSWSGEIALPSYSDNC
ncbi:MAG: HYR domain-containing protein, partial [Paludibacteraceae bacterium]|nr:HYR domain-containing protein [Paludibacteraceae bacterium]